MFTEMKLTQILCKKVNTNEHQFKVLWKNYKYKDYPVRVPKPLADKGVKILEPSVLNQPKQVEKKKVTSAPERKSSLAFLHQTRLLEGRKQALLLSKCQEFEGMPDCVKECMDKVTIPKMDTLIQKFIMRSQVWDPTNVRLPKRIDKENVGYRIQAEYGIPRERAMMHLLQDLVRVCLIQANQFPSAQRDRRLFLHPYLGTVYDYEGEPISIRGFSDMAITSSQGLGPFAESALVRESKNHEIESIHPVSPLIDLHTSNFELEKVDYAVNTRCHDVEQKVHTLFHLNKDLNKAVHRQNRALMFLLGYGMVYARSVYKIKDEELPDPICLQCVNMDETTLNFAFLQLNTLDFSSKSGIKNFVWFDSDNRLFARYLPKPWKGKEFTSKRYDSYDPSPIRKLLAVVLNGIPEIH